MFYVLGWAFVLFVIVRYFGMEFENGVRLSGKVFTGMK